MANTALLVVTNVVNSEHMYKKTEVEATNDGTKAIAPTRSQSAQSIESVNKKQEALFHLMIN